jgi:hypothetical protein
MERVAACHCGQLRIIASGEPGASYLCHCQACQRRTGSAAHWGSRWNRAQIRVEGSAKVFVRTGASGFDLRSHFCPECGTTVLLESDRRPALCTIPAGCFADQAFPPPTFGIWEESMHAWFSVPSVSEHHQRSMMSPTQR